MSSPRFFSLLSAVLFLTLCAYIGAAIYPRENTAQTAASHARLTQYISLRGIALREERAYTGSGTAENAARIAAGEQFCISGGGRAVLAPCSAVYFSSCDGFEYLSPSALEQLDHESLEALISRGTSPSAMPRLVTSHVWYYAALAEDGVPLPDAGHCRILFDGFDNETSAYLISASAPYKGQRMLLFRLTAGGEAYLSLRQTSAKLVIAEDDGLLIPAAALYECGGKNYVNTFGSAGEEQAEVDIIYYHPDDAAALVRPRSGKLTAGASVILKERR